MAFPKRKNLPAFLMIASMILLTVFQIFWLRGVYQDQFDLLRQETDNLFLKSVRTLQDSMLNRIVFRGTTPGLSDTIVLNRASGRRDSMSLHILAGKYPPEHAELRVREEVITRGQSVSGDSIAIKISKQLEGEAQTHMIALWISDTLAPADIQQRFTSALALHNIPLDFDILALTSQEEHAQTGGIVTSTVLSDGDEKLYAARFPEFDWYLLRRIFPEIAFSILLLSLTFFSFYLIYSNLLKQRRLTKIKNDFVSNITHELKTPITTVGVALEALSNFNVLQQPEKTTEYLNISKSELGRLTLLVDKVLKMATFENQEPQLKVEPVNADGLIRQVLKNLKVQFEQASASVNFRTSGSDFLIRADRTHLTNVVYNLLDNALKYSGPKPVIDIHLGNAPGSLSLAITDNGIGIPRDFQDKIFDKFFRVPAGNRHNTKGHGLGLSYVAGVIKKHGGRIELESQPGQGSTFTIKLPRQHESN